jgi:hypothetical protein
MKIPLHVIQDPALILPQASATLVHQAGDIHPVLVLPKQVGRITRLDIGIRLGKNLVKSRGKRNHSIGKSVSLVETLKLFG